MGHSVLMGHSVKRQRVETGPSIPRWVQAAAPGGPDGYSDER